MKSLPVLLLISLGTALFYVGAMLYHSSLIIGGIRHQQRWMMMANGGIDENDDRIDCPTKTTTATKTKSSSRVLSPSFSSSEDPCEYELQEIFRRNECFRSYTKTQDCTTSTSSYDYSAAPLHLHGYYDGQGFGRMIHHTIDTCLFAAALQRPCVIDMDVKDKYYTWRSFLNVGAYNWDYKTTYLHQNESVKQELQDAYSKLPKPAKSEWDDTILSTTPTYHKYNHVLPLYWNANHTTDDHYQYWHASNPETHNKVLLSPSFGFGWWYHGFSPTQLVPYFKRNHNNNNNNNNKVCDLNILRTKLQNAMYQPTTLSYQLFEKRSERFFERLLMNNTGGLTTMAQTSKLQTKQQLQQQRQRQMQPSIPTTTTANHKKYGAIHLRTTKSDLKRTFYDNEEALMKLQQCIQSKYTSDIDTWWLVSDNFTNAEYVEQRIDAIHTDYDYIQQQKDADKEANQNKKINYHSGFQMMQVFGQPYFALSMEDFMVLHQSTVAIVTHGAFGDTGARGNGKIKVDTTCGGKDNMFKVYRRMDGQ